MGISCYDIGKAVIIRRNGTRKELTVEETVKICEESLSTGISFQDIVKRTEPNLKVLRFIQEE